MAKGIKKYIINYCEIKVKEMDDKSNFTDKILNLWWDNLDDIVLLETDWSIFKRYAIKWANDYMDLEINKLLEK